MCTVFILIRHTRISSNSKVIAVLVKLVIAPTAFVIAKLVVVVAVLSAAVLELVPWY